MKGFTLIEVLISISIFAIVMIIVINAIILGNNAYLNGEKMMTIMQNGRVVLDAVSREIRQSRKIVTLLPENEQDALSEIIFQDGHLKIILEEGIIQSGSLNQVILPNSSSEEDDFYKDAFIEVTNGPFDLIGKIRKIVSYNGDSREAYIEFPFDETSDYFGLEYTIDTLYSYIHYYLDEDGLVMRRIYYYYFSGDSNVRVPFNAVPPEQETLEIEVLEEPRIIGENFQELKFWGLPVINIFLKLKLDEKEINLSNKIFGRNL